MTAGERIQKRRAIFADSHVLVARNPQIAIRAGLPLHPSAYDAAMAEKARHGSSQAQGSAPTAAESREEHLLRSSMCVNPQPMPLLCVDGTFKEVCCPSKSTLNALYAFERSLEVEFRFRSPPRSGRGWPSGGVRHSVAMSVVQGHRTGIYQHLKVARVSGCHSHRGWNCHQPRRRQDRQKI